MLGIEAEGPSRRPRPATRSSQTFVWDIASGSMSGLHRSLVLATELLGPLAEIPQRSQSAGFHRVWSTEFQGRDAVVRATANGLSTTTLQVGTGIAYAFSRAPRALAAAAMDAQELTGGRFTLGLGAGTRGLRRGYGVDEFDPPATRLAETFEALRATWAEHEWQRSVAPPPLAAGGVNETMIAVSTRHADRVLLHPLCLIHEHLEQRILPAIERGQSRRSFGVAALSAWCITSVDDDASVARERARRQLAFYLSTPGYRGAVDGTPWESVADAIRTGFADGARDWDALSQYIPDELLAQVSISGTPSSAPEVADQMARRLESIDVDEMVFQCVDAGSEPHGVVRGLNLVIDVLRPEPISTSGEHL